MPRSTSILATATIEGSSCTTNTRVWLSVQVGAYVVTRAIDLISQYYR